MATSVAPRVAVLARLRAHLDRTALVDGDASLTYRELVERVDARAAELGSERRLVVVEMARSTEPIVTYLAALAGGHPAVLVDAADQGAVDRLTAVFDPDVVARTGTEGDHVLDERRLGTAHDLHPDLALLLSTSGSTGSPKLVRLSLDSVVANARSIAAYLDLQPRDRAITALPLHYCYGLSVLNSHLLAGAGVVTSELSVVDRCFWDRVRSTGVTGIAGVPHTFDLLDRVGFEHMDVPSLRYLTQAGGRLAPDSVSRYAALGERRGWDLFVMYGQTEATARMAYLPPHLARTRPHLAGVAIPGGRFTVAPSPEAAADRAAGDDTVGELVYHGPNVMLGYAEEPADLSLGRTCTELRTGDLARLGPDGLVEIVGRLRRFIKPFGLRIDLDEVDRVLRAADLDAVTTGDDAGIVVVTTGRRPADPQRVAALAADATGLPPHAVVVDHVGDLPRLSSGKLDLSALLHQARAAHTTTAPGSDDATATADVRTGTTTDDGTVTSPVEPSAAPSEAVRRVFATVLNRADIDGRATFVDLGGDSLSYVEASTRLESILGHLPPDWHVTPVDDLVPTARPGRRRLWRTMEANVVLRAVAIVLIVASHTRWFVIHGGAHALLGIAGYNFARFQLASGRMVRSIARVAVPSMVWIGGVAALTADFGWHHALLANGQVGGGDSRWAYWFIEAIVQILAVLAVAFAIPPVRRLSDRAPFGFALALTLAGLVLRFDLLGLPGATHEVLRPQNIFWLFALGWAAATARHAGHRLVLTAIVALAVPGLFADGEREAVVAIGLLVLIWVDRVPVPRSLHRLVAALAGASLYIYLVHWEVFPLVHRTSKVLAFVVSMAVGYAVWVVARRVSAAVEARIARQPPG